MSKIYFNRSAIVGDEIKYITEAIQNGDISGDGPFTRKVQVYIEQQLGSGSKVLLTTSCTHALEMSAILLNLKHGDEVIVPAYTFVSTALAFHMHGAKIIFADIRPDTQNIDETKIESLITERTRAIVPVHYAGVGCEMDTIMNLSDKYRLIVIEDNAHGLYGKYKGKFLGTIGHMATQSFHGTKNISCGEGGALIINDHSYFDRAEIIREKGTNRSRFFRGQVDKYTWVDKGSSYVMSDILAAYLLAQVERSGWIQEQRQSIWEVYYKKLEAWAEPNNVTLPKIPSQCEQAFHMFYLLMPSLSDRTNFIEYMNKNDISAVFHYIPLHQSDIGKEIGYKAELLETAVDISERLVRLPMYPSMTSLELDKVVDIVKKFKVSKCSKAIGVQIKVVN